MSDRTDLITNQFSGVTADIEWDTYIRYLQSQNIFSICKDKNILEFASGGFWMSDQICRQQPKTLTCVEPDLIYADLGAAAAEQYELVTTFNGTANTFYSYTGYKKVDVVFCMGLLYHIHSPIDFFEKIINYSSPETIVIETVGSEEHRHGIELCHENINNHGAGFSDNDTDIKLPYNMILGHEDYVDILKHGGYTCISKVFYLDLDNPKIEHKSKKHAYLMIFQKDVSGD